jgi:hypothetical protein
MKITAVDMYAILKKSIFTITCAGLLACNMFLSISMLSAEELRIAKAVKTITTHTNRIENIFKYDLSNNVPVLLLNLFRYSEIKFIG